VGGLHETFKSRTWTLTYRELRGIETARDSTSGWTGPATGCMTSEALSTTYAEGFAFVAVAAGVSRGAGPDHASILCFVGAKTVWAKCMALGRSPDVSCAYHPILEATLLYCGRQPSARDGPYELDPL
jgi:hypothetical protein